MKNNIGIKLSYKCFQNRKDLVDYVNESGVKIASICQNDVDIFTLFYYEV